MMAERKKPQMNRRQFLRAAGLGTLAAAAADFSCWWDKPALAAETRNITLLTSTTSGVWYPMGCGVCNIINKNVSNVNCTATPSPGMSIENCHRIHKREAETAVSVPATARAAYLGEKPFEHKMDVAGWFSFYRGIWLQCALEKTGIKRMADLKGKRIAVGVPGSFTNTFNEKVLLPAHGLEPGDYKPERLTWPETINAMKDGHIDALLHSMSRGNALMQELSMSRDLNWIPVEEEAASKIQKKDPYWFVGELSGEYKIKEPVRLMMYRFQVICGSYLEDDFVYELTKAVFGHLDMLHDIAVVAKDITIETGLQGMPIPPHPGSAKFFSEHGVHWKDPSKT